MMKLYERLKRDDQGAATIVEYAIVLPICLFIILFIFMVGFFLHQASVLEAAAERGILIAQKIYTDPNADNVIDFESTTSGKTVGYRQKGTTINTSNFSSDPYRYWNNGYSSSSIKAAVESKVKNVITSSQLLISSRYLSKPKVTYNGVSGLLFKKASVEVTQTFSLFPGLTKMFGLEPTITLRGYASMRIDSQTEFIRNVDFICDMLDRFKVGQYIKQIQVVFSKISDFFTN